MRNLIIFLSFLVISPALQAQPVFPKREFRAVWVATIANIDYPPKASHQTSVQKYEYLKMLDELEEMGMNAIIFQVRPAADAFYKSSYEPWSAYLTGQQGRVPDQKDFDLLSFMVEEAHKRSMEFHAWLNPYRATFDLDTFNLAANHPLWQHRDWFLKYGSRFYFNPSKPEVRNHISKVVAEIVSNYDIDAIHFDDYFYPYKIRNLPFPDSVDFVQRRGAINDIEDWRRQNVDLLIRQVADTIKTLKPYVQFGISPFGVWRNRSADPIQGSDTRAGQTCYDDLYADVLKWMRNEWIDYVVPQIYWHIGFPIADHKTLVEWWSRHAFGRNLYVGHAAYKVGNPNVIDWLDPAELPNQIRLNRNTYHTQGSIYFSTKSVRNNPLGFADSLRRIYQKPAMIPEMKFLNLPYHPSPSLRKIKKRDKGLKISWIGKKQKRGLFSFLKKKNKENIKDKPYYYVIYKFEGEWVGNVNTAENIFKITSFNAKNYNTIYDPDYEEGKTYTYIISPVNRQHTEGGFSNRRTVLIKNGKAKRKK